MSSPSRHLGRYIVMVIILSVVASFLILARRVGIAKADAFQSLSVVDKTSVLKGMKAFVAAERGDFLVLKSGSVLRILRAADSSDGTLEIYAQGYAGSGEVCRIYTRWDFYVYVDHLVKKTDPEAGVAALRFLEQ